MPEALLETRRDVRRLAERHEVDDLVAAQVPAVLDERLDEPAGLARARTDEDAAAGRDRTDGFFGGGDLPAEAFFPVDAHTRRM